MVKVIVCGGRDFAGEVYLNRQLSTFHTHTPITLLIEGGQTGADRLARHWAVANKVPLQTVDADWNNLGRAAGPIRNGRMLREFQPDWVIAFPGNKGTNNMKKQAKSAGVTVLEL